MDLLFPLEVHVPNTVVSLERNQDELLLVNTKVPQPLYIHKGREYILRVIDAIRDIRYFSQLQEMFPDDTDLFNLLQSHSIIVPGEQLEVDGKSRSQNVQCRKCLLGQKKKQSLSLYLLLSQSCNLGCIYCLNGTDTYQKHRNLKMPDHVAYKAVEKCLEDLTPGGELEIVFFGGEPLLNWHLAKKVIQYCEGKLRTKYPDRNWKYHLTTNLTIFPDDLIAWTKEHHITFLVDIDGPARLHNLSRPFINRRGSYAQITGNLQRLVNQGIHVSLRSTITALNVNHMLEVSEDHKKLAGNGSALVAVNPVTSDTDILPESLLPDPDSYITGLLDIHRRKIWSNEELFPLNTYIPRIAEKEISFHGCGAPYGNTPVVDVYGDVYACIYLVGISRFKLGNIFDDTYPNQNVIVDLLELLNIDHIEPCKDCSWRYLCGGGCPVGKLTVAGNPKASEAIKQYTQEIACKTSKAMIETLLWDYGAKSWNQYRET